MTKGLPSSFESRIRFQLGPESRRFLDALHQEPPVAIRLNPAKQISLGDEAVPWCASGRYLNSRPAFTLDPLFHAGCYYVQDASSMFLEHLFIQLGFHEKPLLILDACASPGGKSTQLASLMHSGSFLVANEVIASRLPALKENLIKWGPPNVMITNADPSAFASLENRFDVILVDAPCSGEGLFRKDEAARQEWSESACELNAARQQRIVTALLPSLKSGGYLIYSTCTFNPAENEKNVRWMVNDLGMECRELQIPEEWGIRKIKDGAATGYGFYPHRLQGEGLFYAVLMKKYSTVNPIQKKSRTRRFLPPGKKLEEIKAWIASDSHTVVKKDNRLFAFHHLWKEEIEFLSDHLKTVFHGGCLAELKGEKAVPVHELAMSDRLNRNAFRQIELSHEDALRYLRKQNFLLGKNENGFAVVSYKNTPLGLVNFVGKRFNNYYPVNWRIRQQG